MLQPSTILVRLQPALVGNQYVARFVVCGGHRIEIVGIEPGLLRTAAACRRTCLACPLPWPDSLPGDLQRAIEQLEDAFALRGFFVLVEIILDHHHQRLLADFQADRGHL